MDLLEKYPTTLTQGDTARDRARAWSFTAADLFELTKFSFKVEDKLKIELGASDVGIGHCSDGAVWAVVIPRDSGKLTSPAASDVEPVAHVWLRFHPGELSRLFPPATVSGRSPSNLVAQVRAVANAKMRSSWQAGGRAMIPAPSELTVDVDTKTGVRRFYGVDTKAKKAEYVSAFEGKPVARPNQ